MSVFNNTAFCLFFFSGDTCIRIAIKEESMKKFVLAR